ncbi:MAG: hypothetical protein D4R97_00605, partial [Bacteroidetes bacterium]
FCPEENNGLKSVVPAISRINCVSFFIPQKLIFYNSAKICLADQTRANRILCSQSYTKIIILSAMKNEK